MSISDEVRIRAVLLRVADETEARGLSAEEARALIEVALPGVPWPAIDAMAERIAAKLAREFNFHDELQMMCEPVWLEYPRLNVRDAQQDGTDADFVGDGHGGLASSAGVSAGRVSQPPAHHWGTLGLTTQAPAPCRGATLVEHAPCIGVGHRPSGVVKGIAPDAQEHFDIPEVDAVAGIRECDHRLSL